MIKNARIESTKLGFEHGCLTCWLILDYGGSVQGFGGYGLDEPTSRQGDGGRKGTAYGTETITRILKTVGVQFWEKLPGKHVRAEVEDGLVRRVGNILKDVWFDPKELAEEMGLT